MKRQRVLLTGSTGGMGHYVLEALVHDSTDQEIVLLVRESEVNRKKMEPYMKNEKVIIVWGDLGDYNDVYRSLEHVDIVLHVAALVSPVADSNPELAMKINYGSMCHILEAINAWGVQDSIKLVSIGTIAQTGDRMPPIHWGRVGDPIKPSVFDYYAVSKVAAERVLIESNVKHWVSLRQTGIMGKKMAEIQDPIMFHNCLDNVLEYVSDRDSGIMLANLCKKTKENTLDNSFWNHIYNIGGGESCRTSTTGMYENIYGQIGIKDLSYVLNPKHFATENFHGTYYLDSDKLNDYLDFRNDDMNYFYEFNVEQFGPLLPISKVVTKLPFGQRIIGNLIKSATKDLPWQDRGTMQFIDNNMTQEINAFWGSKENWEAIPEKMRDFKHFEDWGTVIHIDHGYDEDKPSEYLNLVDMKEAARFRGGMCTSESMDMGDWNTKLQFTCAFGHSFRGSPKLILEGGHWCSVCESESWNYHERAKRDPFFAQVWDPIRKGYEVPQEVKKRVDEGIID